MSALGFETTAKQVGGDTAPRQAMRHAPNWSGNLSAPIYWPISQTIPLE